MKRKILFTLFFTLGLTFIACIGDCPPIEGDYFRLTGIRSINHQSKDGVYLEEGVQIKFEDYRGFNCNYTVSYYSSLEASSPISSGLGQLHALDCLNEGWAGSEDYYESIEVITLNDFNDEYRQGDTISELFNLAENLAFHDSIPIRDYFFYFQLPEPPTLSSAFKVKVIVELQNGRRFEKESPTVVFL